MPPSWHPRVAAGALAFLLAACATASPPATRQVSQGGLGAFEASLTTWPDGFAVAWYDTRDGRPEIYLRLLDTTGRPAGQELRLTESPEWSYEADVEHVAGRFIVAWYERDVLAGEYVAHLGAWTGDGSLLWQQRLSAPGRRGRIPVVAVQENEVFVAWLEESGDGEKHEIWGGWWELNGEVAGPPRRLAPASAMTWNLNAAIDEAGRAWVVFDAAVGTQNDEVFLAIVERERTAVARLTSDDGAPSKYPDIAFGPGLVALGWQDERDGNEEVYLVIAPPDAFDRALDGRARRVTMSPGASIGAYLAWNGARLGLAWSDNSFGPHDIFFQSFDAAGRPLHQIQRITETATESHVPAIRPWRQGFALAWNEYRPGGPAAGHGAAGRSDVVFQLVP